MALSIILFALSASAFYFGGWSIIWGVSLNRFNLLFSGELALGQDFLFGGRYIAILFNSDYYGVVLTARFFDSPMLSYIAFGIGCGAFYHALKYFFIAQEEEE
ncbi:hypothetical protein J6I90_12260 [Pseudidiomarina sp. 1APP75-32.1]|uniref:Uncharacterized protein n=1 Tax=Pseudidiomarina terrestris TaxID=2820060 RepID=A0AAW7R4H1_9GAMM|nr:MULTISPECIES: hypothetical protein [unclassified Pseudidiomarina]MDN7125656.1 hypothetical protein [Pseudidiomarina sp. 1APP75-32.1]MDN7130480.1 hypothetical protein [Pseudidiomarina sp. 1APR75-15]